MRWFVNIIDVDNNSNGNGNDGFFKRGLGSSALESLLRSRKAFLEVQVEKYKVIATPNSFQYNYQNNPAYS